MLGLCVGGPTAAAAASTAGATTEVDCMILPSKVVEIRSPVVGLIEKVHVRRGAAVRLDEPLVTLESAVERSAMSTAAFKAQTQGALQVAGHKARAAREKAKRFQELFEEEFVSAQARDDARAEWDLAEAELKTAQENAELARLEHRQMVEQLNRRVLRSPVNGVVMDVNLYEGSLVDPGDGRKAIMKVAQTDMLRVEATVPVQRFREFRADGWLLVKPEAPFDRSFRARVNTIDRVVDPAAGTFGVVAELENRRQELPGGIRCTLSAQPR
ncbi:MAG TPA: efflux RND transporter periplasmic adaptor subunit [Burkholderiaceae bacterium]|nr:efflux RND transporter periplasmic adaptor subunit [Burkholderiaceae bacterium]HMY98005.1 efflux RND transporter periplasmic adaptor subunit [Burkholderiaceae bacterium]HNB42832.1 efflux RND transporter periplasmic adaptor subunit [Burkholderiaceae bacterium]HNG78730.1 efflux RND transporter periplasmic adaptor subunit [Burkholderiaceae bacterium]